MTQEICDKVVSKVPFMLKYYLDRYKIQEMSDIADDIGLLALNFFPDWLITSNMIEKTR